MNTEAYIKSGLPTVSEERSKMWQAVRDQAASHTGRGNLDRITDIQRPNRSESLKKYAKDNSRHFTMGEFRKITYKLSRIIRNLEIEFNYLPEIKEWIESRPFVILSQRRDIWDWINEILIPKSLTDPNAVLIAWPYYNGEIPPADPEELGGIPENKEVNIGYKIIGSKKIRYIDPDTLVFNFGEKKISRDRRETTEPVYMMVSRDDGYIMLEPEISQEGKVVYFPRPWFALPLKGTIYSTMVGTRCEADEDSELDYQESFAHPAFEYFDEAIASFQDSQAVRTMHAYPKMIIDTLPCPAKCKKGKVTVYKEGQEIEEDCKVCGPNGDGTLKNVDPYGVITRPQGFSKDGPISPVIEFKTPPSESLRFLYDISFDLILRGQQVMGLNLLGQEAESGTAKLYRLEDLEDMIQAFTAQLGVTVTSFLDTVTEIRTIGRISTGNTISTPRTFSVQSPADMVKIMEGVPDTMRSRAFESAIRAIFDGDISEVNAHLIALEVEPFLISTTNELKEFFGLGLVTDYTIWARMNVVKYVKEGLNIENPEANTPQAIEAIREKMRTDYELIQGGRGQAAPNLPG